MFWAVVRSGPAEARSQPASQGLGWLRQAMVAYDSRLILTPDTSLLGAVSAISWLSASARGVESSLVDLSESKALPESRLAGPGSLAKFLTTFLVFLLCAVVIVYAKLSMDLVPIAKLLFIWGTIFFFFYLLLSGFVFFLKRYAFGRFTTIISRF